MVAVRFAVALLVICSGMILPLRGARADETLQLEVVVNGYSTNKIGEFVTRAGTLLARPQELRDLGFRVPDSVPNATGDLVELTQLVGLHWRLDQPTQTLYVTADNQLLLPALLRAGEAASSNPPVQSGLGATLDYDVTGTSFAGQNSASGLFDFRGFSPWGVVSSGTLAYAGVSPLGPGTYSAVRLDSTYVYSDPDTMRRYHLGDFINGGLSWTRPVRLGGAQINSDFSMRPDLVTFPLPSIGGTVAVPSTVDVLVNGSQLLSREVQPGPFAIPQLPVVTGAGTVSMTVTNALGRQVTTTLPFYASSELLASGLQTYSIELGAVRRNWGLISNDYGNLAGSASYRRGLSSAVTVEGHTEGTPGQLMAGGGMSVNFENLGVINLAAAASTSGGQSGTQFTLGAQRLGRVISVGASATLASHSFRDIAAMNGDPVPRRQINANAGISLGTFGSFGVAYTGVDRDEAPEPISFYAPPGSIFARNVVLPGGVVSTTDNLVSFFPAEHVHVISATYSVQVRNASLYATGFFDVAGGGGNGVLLGLTIPLGGRSSVNAGVGSETGRGYQQMQAQQSPVSIGDWGYQAYASTGNPSHQFADLQYKSSWALLSAGADRIGNQTTAQAQAQGALSVADGGVFASNTINDSFGIVDTNGIGNIRVLDENREVGRTDSAGRLLVPDLRSFDVNHVAINPTDVPLDTTVPFTTRDVRPQEHSGIVIHFPLRTSRGALLRLVNAYGAPLPVGSVATLQSTGMAVPIGYDGDAYVQDLSRHNELQVEQPNGQRCVVTFDYLPATGEIPTIGPLTCSEK